MAVIVEKRVRTVKPAKNVVVDESPTLHEDDLFLAKIFQVIWFVLALIEILLGFRLVLRLLGANPFSGFTSLVYGLSFPFVTPFNGILRTSQGFNGSVIEWSTVFAMAVYAIIAWLIVYLLQIFHPIRSRETEEIIED